MNNVDRLVLSSILMSLVFPAISYSSQGLDRFHTTNQFIIDRFSKLQWQNGIGVGLSYQEARDYCKNLKLDGYNDWRLPTLAELEYAYSMQEIFSEVAKKTSPWDTGDSYWSADIKEGYKVISLRFSDGTLNYSKNYDYTRCVRGEVQYTNLEEIKKTVEKSKAAFIFDRHENAFKKAVETNTVEGYLTFLTENPNAPKTDKAKSNLNELYSIIYRQVDEQNNIAGYEWYIGNYPASPYAAQSLLKIHDLAYRTASEINSIDSYNDYIIAYPYSKHIQAATKKAYSLEEQKYNKWYLNDEKNSRALLIQSKQLALKINELDNEQLKKGYMLVINRMNELLINKFPAEDATLRYLESEEFRNFVKDFNRNMLDLKSILNDINNNTGNLVSVFSAQTKTMEYYFSSIYREQKMADSYNKEHQFWERYLKDKQF